MLDLAQDYFQIGGDGLCAFAGVLNFYDIQVLVVYQFTVRGGLADGQHSRAHSKRHETGHLPNRGPLFWEYEYNEPAGRHHRDKRVRQVR